MKTDSVNTPRRPTFGIPALVVSLSMLVAFAHAAPGDLDTSFDTDGKVTTDFSGNDDGGYGIAIQTDGKILVAGQTWSGTGLDFGLARYNADGSLDTTFDTDGKVNTDFSSSTDKGRAVALQSDGKIIVAGTSGTDFAIARYNTNGSLDATFDTDGKVTTNIDGGDEGHSVAIQSDGKIIVAGKTATHFALARYNTNGSLDTSFDTDGKVTPDFGNGINAGYCVTVQGDGKILVAGIANLGVSDDFALARYNTDGSLDTGFDTDGLVTTDFGGNTDWGYGVFLQSGGKILVAGDTSNGSNFDFGLVRYNGNGSLDTTFDTDGKVATDFGDDDFGRSVTVQPDGKIVVAGFSDGNFAVARYSAGGSLDPTFSSDGKVRTHIDNKDEGRGVALQADGKIVVAGVTDYESGSDDFGVVRYLGAVFQPDNIIGGKGNNTYNTTGVGQTRKLTSKKAKTVKTTLKIQNDGTAADAFNIRGTRGNKTFKVTYTSGGNVTAAVTAGTLVTPALNPGASRIVRITVKPNKKKLQKKKGGKIKWLKKRLTLTQTSTSQADPTKKDVAKVKVLHK